MELQNEYTLSFYKEISAICKDKNVFLVKHVETGKIYVKKILSVYNASVYLRLKELNLPGIPQIYECIEDDGNLYIIEEYIHGRTLSEICEKEGILSPEDVCEFLIKICPIVEGLHKLEPSIIHRDIKPSNIMKTQDGEYRLIDFNSAKNYLEGANRDTKLLGTENFAAPEQYGFSQSDERTDIYGIGSTANYLLTGKFPNEEIYDGMLKGIIEKCLCFNPAERYQKCEDMLEDVQKCMKSLKRKSKPSIKEKRIDSRLFLILPVAIVAALIVILVKNSISSEKVSGNQAQEMHFDDKASELSDMMKNIADEEGKSDKISKDETKDDSTLTPKPSESPSPTESPTPTATPAPKEQNEDKKDTSKVRETPTEAPKSLNEQEVPAPSAMPTNTPKMILPPVTQPEVTSEETVYIEENSNSNSEDNTVTDSEDEDDVSQNRPYDNPFFREYLEDPYYDDFEDPYFDDYIAPYDDYWVDDYYW